jgi:putative phage-type endonuclease
MLLSDLKQLDCILHTIVPEEEPKYITKQKYEIEFVETCLQLMYEYVNDNPVAISEPDFDDDMFCDVKELFIVHFEGDAFFNESAEEEIDGIIDFAKNMFYEQIMPRRSQMCTYETGRSLKQMKMLEKQINSLSNLDQPEQRTPEWYEFRHNLITASNAYKAFENQTTQNQLIYEKCQPLFVPQPDAEFTQVNTNSTLHWGQKYEPLSVMFYEHDYNTKIGDFGCIQHPQYSFLGASPDGINIDKNSGRYGRMLEIKNIVNREINGNPKKEYWIQMQLQMETCDLNECDFLETKFVEYSDRQEFNEDTDETLTDEDDNIMISKDGFRKGIIIQFINQGKPFYAYKPLELITHLEVEEWEEKTIDLYQSEEYNYTYIKFIYWKLEEISCVLVFRNKKWFQDNIEQIQNIWCIIEKERNTGHSHRAPNRRIKKEADESEEKNDKSASASASGCLLNIKNGKNTINVIKIRTESFDETKSNMNF